MELRDTLDIFTFAESVFQTMKESHVLSVEPANFRIPFTLPKFNATAFAIVSDGRIKEIEIYHDNGKIQTVRPPIT